MTWLSDNTLARLRDAVEAPDLSGTKYRLIRKLASGGMGTVHLVEDTSLGRHVALKVLDAAATQPGMADWLNREAHIIARLEHPGIVPVHDVGTLADGRIYYTMKVVQGQRLDRHIPKVTAMSERLRMFQKVCETVAFAHANGVLHRDLKPDNIMVGAFGEILVMDWGVAKALWQPQPLHTVSPQVPPEQHVRAAQNAIVGTPGYMAPEQSRGDEISEQADVYGLGSVLYFLLTGRPPLTDALTETVEVPITPPRQLNKKVGKGLQAICLKAISYHPADRYATVTDLSADIARFLDGEPVVAYRENVFEKVDRWVTRNRFLVFLILAYLLMRILLIITSSR